MTKHRKHGWMIVKYGDEVGEVFTSMAATIMVVDQDPTVVVHRVTVEWDDDESLCFDPSYHPRNELVRIKPKKVK